MLKKLNCSGARSVECGFTLLELLVVIAIIGLLASYVGPKYYSQIGKSEQSLARSQVEAFTRAVGAFRIDVGRFPTTEEGLAALRAMPSVGAGKWSGPYLDKVIPLDPWGRSYAYRWPSTHGGDFDIESFGKDGQPGGNGEEADVTNY
jgi:general secretion pathway protein G